MDPDLGGEHLVHATDYLQFLHESNVKIFASHKRYDETDGAG